MHLIAPSDSVLWSWEILTLIDNHTYDHDELLLNILGLVCEDDSLTINNEFKGDEVVLECSVSIILSANNLIRYWIGILFEALDESHVLIDRLLDQLTNLVGHECGGTLEERLGLILVEVLKLLSEDVDGALGPVLVELGPNDVNLILLLLLELLKGDWLVFKLRNVDQQGVAVVLLSPDVHKLEGGLGANAEVLRHEHAGHHDVVLPLLIGLDSLVVVVSPSDGLAEDLLDSKPSHLHFVLQDVIED